MEVSGFICFREWVCVEMYLNLKSKLKRLLGLSEHTTIEIDTSRFAKKLEEVANGTASVDVVEPEIASLTDEAAERFASAVIEGSKEICQKRRDFRRGFESRLFRGWEPALCLFDAMQGLCLEFGSDFNQRFSKRAEANHDHTFVALTRIHGRACLTASEIGALLRSGHATGANARWRTLHELAVIALFIGQHELEVAERYIDHQVIEAYKGAKEIQEFQERLGVEGIDKQVEDLEAQYTELQDKYGGGYTSRYGWAGGVLGNPRPNFRHIAQSIDMDFWKPYFRMASHGVHATPRGGFFDIGLPTGVEAIPAGPSHFGLTDPGKNSLISLFQVTAALLTHGVMKEESDIEEKLLLVVQAKTLERLTSAGETAFFEVYKKVKDLPAESKFPEPIWQP